ncbi:hypothetical protein MOTT27_04991 [Mycobacterium intracellulare subsp. yongonense]|nr:hypothetical protein MOTT27_04991 [Mycobacterium intracellulare subsp. yongonense]
MIGEVTVLKSLKPVSADEDDEPEDPVVARLCNCFGTADMN